MKLKSNKIKFLYYAMITFTGIAIFFIWQNNHIVVNEITFENSKIPESFNEYKIAHISDLHNKEFGQSQDRLLKKIANSDPDIIVITGDLIDSNNTDIHVAMDLIKGAVNICPTFYVSGNHEAWSGVYEELKTKLKEGGVTVLDNEKITIDKDGDVIELIGMSDQAFMESDYLEDGSSEYFKSAIESLVDTSKFSILLSHRPELFDIYTDSKVNLVFSGHAHGGQFRLPPIGGIIAPNQGIFPKYTSGIHRSNDTSMVVSRGLGNSIVPVRIFNRPEVVIVTLQR